MRFHTYRKVLPRLVPLALVLFLLAGSAAAQTLGNPITFTDLVDFLKWILSYVIKISIIIVALYIIITGLSFLKAQGNEKEISVSKQALVSVVIGASIILGGWAIVSIVQDTVEQITTP